MREAIYTKSITIALQPDVFRKIKEITDREKISIGEWFRNAAERALISADEREGVGDDQQTTNNQ